MKYAIIALTLGLTSVAFGDEGIRPPGTGIFHEVYLGDSSLLICSISEEGVKFNLRTGTDQETGNWARNLNVSYNLSKERWAGILQGLEETSGYGVTRIDSGRVGRTASTQGYIAGRRFLLQASLDGVSTYSNQSPKKNQLMVRIGALCSTASLQTFTGVSDEMVRGSD